MSFTIVTDVFCDFCPLWMGEGGIASVKAERREAWKKARIFGWKKVDGKHMCANCVSEREEE